MSRQGWGIALMAAAVLAASALPFAPGAWAQEPLRYTITPADEGFVRLDTQTGAITHCASADGIWRCAPPLYAESEIDARLRVLDERIEGLGVELATLAGRLAEMAAPLAPPAQLPDFVAELPAAPMPPPAEPPAANGPNFFEEAIDRLLRLVGGMKG
ncbi:MAG: hypothetical protein IT535_14585 [Bauldia sp.]|nr:hypothetical protein [Bauldia sp.]